MQNSHQYYGGQGQDLGQVTAYSAQDWAGFISEVLANPIMLNVTRSQYFSLQDKHQKDKAKRVAFFTPAAFNAPKAQRVYSNAVTCNLVALDIDDPTQAAPLVQNPGEIISSLKPHPCAAYLTTSSTPSNPRLRIVVPAKDLPVKDYARAAQYLAKRLGLPAPNKESKVAVQPMYRPTVFRGEDSITHHPLIVVEDTGVPIVPRMLKGTTLEDSHEFTPRPETQADVGDLDFLRPQMEDVTMDDVKDALNHLDPDCPYLEWLEVAAALKHQFPSGKEATAAYELFNAWSGKGEKYVSGEETLRKWQSLRVYPKGRPPVTVRSLFHRAKTAGWVNQGLSQRAEQAVRNWMMHPGRTLEELKYQGIRKIAASAVQDELSRMALLSDLKRILAHHKMEVNMPFLRKQLHSFTRRLPGPGDKPFNPTSDAALPPWARGLCYVSSGDSFYLRTNGQQFTPPALDRYFGEHLQAPKDADGSNAQLRPQDYLLNVAHIRRVNDYRYSPAAGGEPFICDEDVWYVNTYRPTYPEPDPIRADEAGEVLQMHLRTLIKEPEYRRTVLDFMAFQVQNPGRKIRWALLLQGAQGCGKSALHELMKAVLGKGHVFYVDSIALFGSFTGWTQGHQLVTLDEAKVTHDRYEIMNKLKPYIANDTIVVRQMYCPEAQHPNVTNYMLLTNHQNCLALTGEDRRYFVVFSDLQTRDQVALLPDDYFPRLFRQINDNPGGLRSFLLDWKVSDTFNPDGHAPMTHYFQQMVEASAPALSSSVKQTLADCPHPLVASDLVSLKHLKDCLDHPDRITDQHLAACLREEGYVRRGRYRVGDQRLTLWVGGDAHIPEAKLLPLALQRLKAVDPLD